MSLKFEIDICLITKCSHVGELLNKTNLYLFMTYDVDLLHLRIIINKYVRYFYSLFIAFNRRMGNEVLNIDKNEIIFNLQPLSCNNALQFLHHELINYKRIL